MEGCVGAQCKAASEFCAQARPWWLRKLFGCYGFEDLMIELNLVDVAHTKESETRGCTKIK